LRVELANRRRHIDGDGGQRGQQRLARKRQAAGGHAIQDAAKAEQVRAGIDRFGPGLFGSHVVRRADDFARLREGRGRVGVAGQAEVENLHPSLGRFEPNVRRFDVAMHDAPLVRHAQPRGNFAGDPHRRPERQRLGILEPLLERAPLQQLHGEEGNALVLAYLVDRDDVVVLQGGGRLCLAEKPLPRLLVGGLRTAHHLEGDAAAQLRVLRQQHPAHAALTQLVQDLVVQQLRGNEIGLRHGWGLWPGCGLLACTMHDGGKLIPRGWM
jgi:hypothetical protein